MIDSVTQEIIASAYRQSDKLFSLKYSENKIISQLQKITDPNALSILLPLVFCNKFRLASAVSVIINKLVSSLTPVELYDVIEKINREYLYNPIIQKKYDVNIDKIKNLKLDDEVGNTIYSLISSHPNGYIREAALKQLNIKYNSTLAILLMRANDWVEEISNLASRQLMDVINTRPINIFVPYICLLKKLSLKSRGLRLSLGPLIESRLNFECFDDLVTAIKSTDIIKSRIAFDIAAADKSKTSQVISAAMLSHDIVIKLKMIKLASDALASDSLYQYLLIFLKDKLVAVRRKATYILISKFREKSEKELVRVLFDKSFSLRELARFTFRQSGIDVANIYRNAILNREPPIDIAICGLAETGVTKDFQLISPFINNASLTLRCAGMYSVFKLKPENRQSIILTALPTADIKMMKVICDGLSMSEDEFDLNKIQNKFCENGSSQAIFTFMKFRLSHTKDRWDLLEFILDYLLDNTDLQILQNAQHALLRWIAKNNINNFFTRPDDSKLDSLIEKTDKLILINKNDILSCQNGSKLLDKISYEKLRECLRIMKMK